jgi:hypothetical protein
VASTRTLGFALVVSVALATGVAMTPAEAVAQSPAHVHEASLRPVALFSRAFGVKCDALFLGDARPPAAGISLLVEGAYTYSHCTSGCVVTEESSPTEIEVLGSDPVSPALIGYDLIHLDCPTFANCTYKRADIPATFARAHALVRSNDRFSIDGRYVEKESGALCLDVARLELSTTPAKQAVSTGQGSTAQ